MSAAMATAMGKAKYRAEALAASKTTRICSVAYATDDSASDEKMGRARTLGRSVCSIRHVGWLRPTSTRFTSEPRAGRGPTGRRSRTADLAIGSTILVLSVEGFGVPGSRY